MYNEERKTRFITEYTQDERNQRFCYLIFSKSWKYEELSQCDIAEMSYKDAQKTLNQICDASESSVRNTLTILRAYMKWCKANGFHVNDHAFGMEISAADSVRDNYVASPMHLAKSLAYVFPEPDELSIQYLCRAYLWMAFMGLQEDEASRVTVNDIDFDTMTIRLTPSTWHTYPIYAESVRDLRMAATMESLKSRVGRGTNILIRHPGAEILRTSVDGKEIGDMIVKTIRPAISRAGKSARERAILNPDNSAGICLTPTYTHMLQSGIFYRMYEEERLGITPNFAKYAEISLRTKMSEGASKEARRKAQTARSDIRRRFENEYARWKNVYVV